MLRKDHPEIAQRQEHQTEALGNPKVYHMDIDEILGKSPTEAEKLAFSRKRFADADIGRAGNEIDEFCDQIHDNLHVSFIYLSTQY